MLFGPVVNTALNLVLAGPVVGTKLEPPRELRAHAAGSLAAGAAGGFSAYLAVSNTAIHLKCGGTSRASAPEATGAKCSLPDSRWSTVQISGAAASSGRRAMYSP